MLQREINPVDGQDFTLSFKGQERMMTTAASLPGLAAASAAAAGACASIMMMTMTMTTRMRGGSG